MSYTSNLNGVPVIDDSNYQSAVQYANAISQFGSGYVPRDYQARPEGSIRKLYTGPIFDEKELKERIQEKEQKHKSGLATLHRFRKMPILNQGRYGYCWMYGTVMAMMLAYAQSGSYVPHLSAASAAAKGKNYRNEGGMAEEALGYIDRFGVSTVKYWPDGGVADPKFDTPEQRANAALHKVLEFEELPRNNPLAVLSALVIDLACTGAFNWWGHLVALAQPRIVPSGAFGIEFPNSWGLQYGNQGWGVLSGSKMIPFEAYVIRSVTPVRRAA